MAVLSNLTIRARLALLATLPILSLLYFSLTGVLERRQTSREMADVQGLVAIAARSSAVIHEVQKERGMTGAFIGSRGNKFGEELREQRMTVDMRIAALESFLESSGGQRDVEFSKSLAQMHEQLSRLNETRAAVSELQISAGQAIGYYSGLNASLLTVIEGIARVATQGEVIKAVHAYTSLLEGKEKAGLERAILANTFTEGGFAPGNYQRFSSLLAQQQTYMALFRASASADQVAYFDATVTGQSVNAVEQMRKIALERTEAGALAVDPAAWYDAATARINLLKTVEDRLSSDLDALAARLRSEASQEETVFIGLTILALVITLAGAAVITRSVVRPLNEAVRVADLVANGDLTTEITVASNDETGRLLRALMAMNANLRRIIGRVRTSAVNVASASNELAQGNEDLAKRTEEQASSLEETTASMQEMTTGVRQNADFTRQATELAVAARQQAEKGGEVVARAVTAMSAINDSSQKIADIIGVMDEIAFQTNLLALNAAVEAANAGEYGRGFAVVANEVRSLAQRSGVAAREIRALIQLSLDRVSAGSQLVHASGDTLQEIVRRVKGVADLVTEISTATDHQAQGIEQVQKAMSLMDDATQQNAALVEQAAATSRSLEMQARALSDLMNFFNTGDTGHAAPAQVAAASSQRGARRKAYRPGPRPSDLSDAAGAADGFVEF